MLPDGRYDAIILAADPVGGPAVRVEVVVVSGPHKGEVVSLDASGITGDPLRLLGLPATLAVSAGTLRLDVDA